MGTVQFNPKTGARGIEWCTETRNVLGGCMHRCQWVMPSGEIAECYAKTIAERGPAAAAYKNGFESHYWRPHALRELVAGGAPELVFMDSMSDLFGSWVPEEQVITILETLTKAPQHTYQCLTKAPRRILKFIDHLPGNLWAGVSSAPDFMMGHELTAVQKTRYMHVALETLAEVRQRTGNIVWMSIEPLSWDVADIVAAHPGVLDWVIIGAASSGRRYFQPDALHVDRLLDVLDAQGVATFYKGNIRSLFDLYDFGTGAKNRWREDFPVRAAGSIPGPAPAVARRERMARQHGWTPNMFMPEETPAGPEPARPTTAVQPALFG